MPLVKQNVIVSGYVFVPPDPGDHVPDMGAHPEFPIYYPTPLPPDLVDPPGIWGGNDPYPTPPIYIPVPPPEGGKPPGIWGGNDPYPTPPIYLPVKPPVDLVPPGIWGGSDEGYPTPPIYLPIKPDDPELPDLPPWSDLPDAVKEKIKSFLLGNLPPYEGPPSVQPV